MIISSLKQVVYDANKTKEAIGKPIIKNPYVLYQEMKKKNLKVSRSILTRLWNDNPNFHKNQVRGKYKRAIANSVSFETLNKLVKFFNKPVNAFIEYVTDPTLINIQSAKYFIKHHDLKDYHLKEKDFPKHSTVLTVIDNHKLHGMSKPIKRTLLAVVNARAIKAGLLNFSRGFTIQYGRIERLYPKNKLEPAMANACLFDIFKHLTNRQRHYLDECIICNDLQNRYNNYDIHTREPISSKRNRLLNVNGDAYNAKYIPFWRFMKDTARVNILDSFGTTSVNLGLIRNPNMQLFMPTNGKLQNSSTQSSYNFQFKNEDLIQYQTKSKNKTNSQQQFKPLPYSNHKQNK